MSKPKLFIISLEKRSDRQEQLLDTVKQLESQFFTNFFPAVNGSELNEQSKNIEYLMPPILKESAYPKVRGGLFRSGVAGCILSHFALWQRLVEDPHHGWYIICEDDIVFTSAGNAKAMKLALEDAQRFNCGLLYFAGPATAAQMYEEYGVSLTPGFSFLSKNIVEEKKGSVGTMSYAISKRAAQSLIGMVYENGLDNAADWFMIDRWDKLRNDGIGVLGTIPWLIHNRNQQDSDVQNDHSQHSFLHKAFSEYYLQ